MNEIVHGTGCGMIADDCIRERRRVKPNRAVTTAAIALLAVSCVDEVPSLPTEARASKVVVAKAARTMTLLAGDQEIASFHVALGRESVGPRQCEGDGRTPEGTYRIDFHKPDSAFYRALHVSYPSPQDVLRAEALGCKPGGDIMIHGIRNGLGFLGPVIRRFDTTEGCIGLTNEQMDAIWETIPDGTEVRIEP